MEAKRVSDSITEQVHMLMSPDINGQGRLFGGQLLRWIDEVAGVTARRHCGRNVTTAAIDQMAFKSGAYLNEIVVLVGRITYVGKTSMEVRVDTYTEALDGSRQHINRAYIDMVAINQEGTAIEVPDLMLETEEEKAEYVAAVKRKEMRKQRRLEGF